MYPSVDRYGDMAVESFESYYARWPDELASIPESVVKDWVYRHWKCFSSRWMALQPHTWSFQPDCFANDEILAIDHVGSWIADLDAEGEEYVGGAPRSKSRLAQFMLSHGTFPVPIIVARNAGHLVYPESGKPMKTPLQLIEGHCRLACLRGMIRAMHPSLQSGHRVWVVQVPLRPTNGTCDNAPGNPDSATPPSARDL